jgi:hypothetical protein
MTCRREFITLLGGAAAWPVAANAQRRNAPLIGYLSGGAAGPFASVLAAFRQGLGVRLCRGVKRYDRIPLGQGSI